jgi:hypothetical protein
MYTVIAVTVVLRKKNLPRYDERLRRQIVKLKATRILVRMV